MEQTTPATVKEETLRDICNENVNIASEIRNVLDNALGTSPPQTATECPISSDIIEQALESARQTRGLLRGISTTLVGSIINRI